MRFHRGLSCLLAIIMPAALVVSAVAQQREPTARSPAHQRAKRVARSKSRARAKPAPAPVEAKPSLVGQYGEWGAYTATPSDKKICFVVAKPISGETKPPNRSRGQPYMFVTTRPADKVTDEVSIVIGYPFKRDADASAQVGGTTYALYTEGDGAWIKNPAEEMHMIDAMRAGDTAIVKGVSTRGTQTTDTYSLKGISQALDRIAQECKPASAENH